ncbi:ThiF family adenylyltransferase [Chloroflexota bacterium]
MVHWEQATSVLTKEDLTRYNRQIIYEGFGEEGQRKLKESHVIIAGVGGLGCTVSTYFACAGVGHITIIDCDTVELSNLNRQILHWDENIGEKKITSAAQKLGRLNPSIEVVPLHMQITKDNVRDVITGSDLVIDALDNFTTRFILNWACVAENIPFIHGGISGLSGQVTTIIPGETPCLACISPQKPKESKPFPVFGVTSAFIAIIQATEAIKLLAGFGRLLTGRMLHIDEATMNFHFRDLVRNPDCEVCRI